MMGFDDRDGKNPIDFNKVHENEQKVAAGTVMRPNGDGTVSVINPATGQVLYTGSASGAANSNANNGGIKRIRD